MYPVQYKGVESSDWRHVQQSAKIGFGITLNGMLGNQTYVDVICQHVFNVDYTDVFFSLELHILLK